MGTAFDELYQEKVYSHFADKNASFLQSRTQIILTILTLIPVAMIGRLSLLEILGVKEA